MDAFTDDYDNNGNVTNRLVEDGKSAMAGHTLRTLAQKEGTDIT
jgi:hypothetical protein